MATKNVTSITEAPSLVGQVVRVLRKSRGIGINTLGQSVGIEPANLSRFERGLPGGVHTNKYLEAIAMRLGTHGSILYAISEIAADNPAMLEETEAIVNLVERLTLLIRNYLQLPLEIQEIIDEMIRENL